MLRPVCVITGATGGIGAALSQLAAHEGYDLILHGRSESKLTQLLGQLKEDTPELNAQLVVGDLSTAAGAHEAAAAISDQAPKLDLLFNNAGILLDGIQMSSDGLEMHTQVNLIAPYILMKTLKPNVARAKGAIINVSSGAALKAKTLSVETLTRPEKAKKLYGAYAASKLALSVVTNVLGGEFASDGVALASVNPGPNKTEMTASHGMPRFLLFLRPLIYASPEKGASKVFDVSRIAKVHPRPGAFFTGRKEKALPQFAESKEVVKKLLTFCHTSAELPGVG